MRRSSSSSCLLRPRSSLTESELASGDSMRVTMVNTRLLPRYAAERYYVLSELEMHAHSVRFLCDYGEEGIYSEGPGAAGGRRPPRDVVLYLLWRPGTYPSARAFAEGPVAESLGRLIGLRGGDAGVLDPDDGEESSADGAGASSSPRLSPRSPMRRSVRMGGLGGRCSSYGNIPSCLDEGRPMTSPLPLPPLGDRSADRPTTTTTDAGEDGGPDPPPPPTPPRPPLLRRSSSVAARARAEALRSRTRTRVYLAVDRLSQPPPRPSPPQQRRSSAFSSDADADAEGGVPSGGGAGGDEVGEGADGAAAAAAAAASEEEGEGEEEAERIRLRHHRVEVMTSESLAKHVASSPTLRPIVDGIAVGTTSEARAAPALEAAMGAAAHGSAERRRGARRLNLPWARVTRRRRKGRGDEDDESDDGGGGGDGRPSPPRAEVDPAKSAVGVLALHPDDLVGIDPDSHPDAAQGVLQSLTVAEWGGNGDAQCFARRAMGRWRARHGMEDPDGDGGGGGAAAAAARTRRRRRRSEGAMGVDEDDMATTMVVAFLVCVISYLWSLYGEQVRGLVSKI